MRTGKPQLGFTLLEMMVSISLGLIVMAAMTSLFKTGMNTTTTITQRAEVQQNLRAAIELMSKDISLAGAGLPNGGVQLTTAGGVSRFACNQAGFEVASEAVQIMGATGFSREALVEYCMRRTRGWMIAGGSIEILKNRIAEHVFERRFDQRKRRAEAAE